MRNNNNKSKKKQRVSRKMATTCPSCAAATSFVPGAFVIDS
jgi:hypothetical protein